MIHRRRAARSKRPAKSVPCPRARCTSSRPSKRSRSWVAQARRVQERDQRRGRPSAPADALLHREEARRRVHPPSAKGDPADILISKADEIGADLIVVGNKGMKGVRRVLGHVPNSVAHGAACSVFDRRHHRVKSQQARLRELAASTRSATRRRWSRSDKSRTWRYIRRAPIVGERVNLRDDLIDRSRESIRPQAR